MRTSRTIASWVSLARVWSTAWLGLSLAGIVALPAGASGATKTDPQVQFDFQAGEDAAASFDWYDESGCILVNVFVSASEEQRFSLQQGGTKRRFVDVGISVTDLCQGMLLVNAFGEAENLEFEFDPWLRSCSVVAKVTLFDYMASDFIDVDIQVNWSAVGKLNHEEYTVRGGDAGSLSIQHVNDFWRDAQATGTICGPAREVGSGGLINYIPVVSSWTTFDKSSMETLTFTR